MLLVICGNTDLAVCCNLSCVTMELVELGSGQRWYARVKRSQIGRSRGLIAHVQNVVEGKYTIAPQAF